MAALLWQGPHQKWSIMVESSRQPQCQLLEATQHSAPGGRQWHHAHSAGGGGGGDGGCWGGGEDQAGGAQEVSQ